MKEVLDYLTYPTINIECEECGCDIEEEFVGTYDDAVDFANEYLPDYAEQFAHTAFGWDEEYDEDEFEEYRENCGYEIEESEEEE